MFKGLKITCFIFLFAVHPLSQVNLTAQKRIRLPEVLNENSGLSYSQDGTCLWINDSNNQPALYQTNPAGKVIKTFNLPSTNNDWEDLTKDAKGNYYIGDIGDNNKIRTSYKIYKLSAEKVLFDSIEFRYQNQKAAFVEKVSFDAEALVWIEGKLHLFTKGSVSRKDFVCRHYILEDNGSSQLAVFEESRDFGKYVITGAALSPDGKTVALLAYRYKFVLGFIPDTDSKIFFFKPEKDPDHLFQKQPEIMTLPTWFGTRQYESIDFINNDQLIIAAEKTFILKPLLRKIKIKTLN